MDREIIIVVDPMCSWCWGFSPTIGAIAEEYGARVPISLIAGGLRPLTDKPMTEQAKGEIRHHWEDVNKASGQPFDWSFFNRNGFVYDTEPACRALVTVRSLKAEAALAFLAAVHKAFYAENRDVTNAEILQELAVNEGIDANDFTKAFSSRQMTYETAGDFHRSHTMGVRGFPTVILRTGEKATLLCAGFRPFDGLKPHLDEWVAGKEEDQETQAEG
ncbi:MAG: DsbA family protein [Rhodospirillales bacterium]|nr:DsbA family protein [Rhodospirillales bacterium]